MKSMNKYRSAALILACSAASLSAAACSAGITTATPPATTPPATSAPAPSHSTSSAAASASPTGSSRLITISGPIGHFPVPAGAKVAENVAGSQEIVIIFSAISPAKVSSFYATALPQAGYSIATNSVLDQGDTTVAVISFTGHGYKGNIDALAHFSDPKVNIAGLGTKNVTTITFLPS
jgi:hypothetical protein